MSEDSAAMNHPSCCASCGIAEIDDIKLTDCDGCDLVKYCSDECQASHKSEHKEDCKKRAAEIREEILLKQPEGSYMGDCPICCLPISFDQLDKPTESSMMMCCSKSICNGCATKNLLREVELRLAPSCPFCREPTPSSEEECNELLMKRVAMNDPVAMCQKGWRQFQKGECSSAFGYFTKAAELGDANAHYGLASMYYEGKGVEEDKGKYIYHFEEAAIGGHPMARYNLGLLESKNSNMERAVKHWTIAAALGYDAAIKALMGVFKSGLMEKDVLAAALRAHKAAVDAMKSPQREKADEVIKLLRR